MPDLRVALVAPSLDILGGQAVQADRLLRAWRGDPIVDAYLVPINPPLPRPLRAISHVKYARTILNELTYGPLLFRELARADVVHVFSASYTSFLLAPLPAIAVARTLGKPVVLNYRSGEAPDHLGRSTIARRTIARVERNVVPSGFLAGVFRQFGIPSTIIPNIVDLERFRFRRRIPLRPRLLSTRNLDALYNVGTTLQAFGLVQGRWPDASLTLVGGGREEAALRRQAGELGLRNVIFAGRLRPDQIADAYASHDIYLQSPDIDNMPTSVIEAFASGLPVVSTNAGGIPHILDDGREGLLAPCGDADALAGHVLRLLNNPVWAQQLADTAFAGCRAYTWPSVRGQWLDVYRGVAANQAAPAPKTVLAAEASDDAA
ncbi:MAG TPA: glycosyltransferase family 4 protein [Vicinamibacterales bacterium]|jgi:glycosyltransferase involved in cell wall biosynthesis